MSRPGGYERVLSLVRAAKVALRRSEVLSGLGVTVLGAGLAVVVLAALDNLFRLPMGMRIALLLAAAAFVGRLVVIHLFRPAVRALPDDAVAVRIETAAGIRDNGIINALQLGREGPESGLSGSFARAVVRRGAAEAAKVDARRVVDLRRVGRSLAVGAGAVLLVVLYALLLPRHFANALERYARPAAFVPPVSATLLDVTPGDASILRGEPLTVSAVARGRLPSSARILVSTGGDFEPSEMLFDGRAFSFRFESVEEPFAYRVEAADASSPLFHVGVTDLPGVESLTLSYRYPRYLGLEDRTEKDATGEIRAPVGTRVTVLARLNVPVTDAALAFEDGSPHTMEAAGERAVRGEILVRESGIWSIVLRTADGVGNRDPVQYRIVAVPDEPPYVAFTAPGKDLAVTLPAEVQVTVRARDDHGLSEISLLAERGVKGDSRVLRTWNPGGRREQVVSHRLRLAAGDLRPGETLTLRAEARDLWPDGDHVGRSRPLVIRIVTSREREARAEAELADLADRLRALLEKERGIRRDTGDLRAALATGDLPLAGVPARATSLAEGQSAVGGEMVAAADSVRSAVPALAAIRGALQSLSVNEVVQAVRRLEDAGSRGDRTTAGRDLKGAEGVEDRIVARLEELLGTARSLLEKLKSDPEAFLDETMEPGDPRKAIRDAVARLKKFIREQEDVIRQTRELEQKDVDDFTEEDLKQLEKLAAQESELARFLEDLKDDLSKVPDQDLANSSVLKELIRAYADVELAADALTRKIVELAVPKEQSGLELAEKLEENLEKWLPDVRDYLKWNMEEMDGEMPEVPMAELPDQLEDLMGDLIESEEQLAEDAQDVTSGWADSLDEGAGWGTMNGPISNMSAQGKTGNVLPDSNEIGGRSGEGRSGRSHGEMVGAEAIGKGGRRTPTRLTPDAWEGKAVKDRSTDPLGGATGGGKLAGGAAEGLRGPLPPKVKGDLGRLHGNQVAIRQRAEKLDRALRKLHYPDEEVERSVVLMRELEEALARGDLAGFSRKHALLMKQLKEGQKTLVEHARVVRDRSRSVPKELMRELETVDLANLPEGYRALLREYYKILSRGGSR